MICTYCRKTVDPTSKTTYTRVEGWERRAFAASRRGGSDIIMREQRDEYAHSHCVEKERHGIAHEQETFAW
jgi:hypothetical protein